jgi:DNA-directed RNA polymerase specialized sigma24 family protein
VLGLIRAALQQDDRSPADFYARFRIWGAMLNAVQGEPWWWATARADYAGDYEPAASEDAPEPIAELSADLADALAALTPLQRELLHLVYEHGESLRHIGHTRVLEIGWRRVQHEHQEALDTLRGILESDVRLPKAA